ncbi:non-heme iron oxygenase ferredoxin subunit [Calditrichota bacterium]
MTNDQNGGAGFIHACSESDLDLWRARRIDVAGVPVALYHLEDGFYAIEDSCSHAGASLTMGQIEEGEVVACPHHGARFNIKTGQVLSLPAVRGVRSYEVKVEDGEVYIRRNPVTQSIPTIMRLK